MGRCVVTPLVKMNGQEPPAPRLLWYDITRAGEEAGEILAAFELFLVCAATNLCETRVEKVFAVITLR